MPRPAVLLLTLCACAARPVLPLEEVFRAPDGRLPARFAFSRDGTKLAYVKAREDGLSDLWVYDLAQRRHEVLLRAGGPQDLSPEERAARERRRERTTGIGRYEWNPADDSILLTLSGDLHVLRDGALERLTETEAPELDAKWSPDGTAIAYVRERNLHVRRGLREWRLTEAGGGVVSCGLAEFIAMEELGRHEGFWWSKDSRLLAYVEVDESEVPRFLMHDYLDPRGRSIEQAYPRAGDPNARWTLKVVPAAGAPPVPMKVAGEYLVRVDWTPDHRLAVQVADRPQRNLRLFRCDPRTGEAELLLEETDDRWLAFHSDLRFLDAERFLWTSERSGRRQLYLRDGDGLRALTREPFEVASVAAVTPEGVVFLHGSFDPLERHLFALEPGGEPGRLTQPGWHAATVSADGRHVVDVASRAGEPPQVRLLAVDAALRHETVAELAREDAPPGLPRPRFLEIAAEDGTPLRAMLLRDERAGPGPGLVHCYGGPGAQLVADRWGGATYLWHARLAQQGYTVLIVDGRGSGGYGRDFARVVAGRLCDREARDQAAAARWLAPRVRGGVGIWGWSYGGTLTLACLLDHPQDFAAGVAVAPVTDWRDYDTAYTERYLGLPAANPDGYDLSSPVTRAKTLARPLLLVHGFLDDNVHFRGAVAFLDEAVRAGRPVELDLYPRGAHGIGGRDERRRLFTRMERFLDAHLR